MANTISIGVAYSDPAISGGTLDNTPIGATTASTAKFTTMSVSGNSSIGAAASTLVGFHGAAVSQASFLASITGTFLDGSVSASAIVGFSRGTMSNALTLLNSIESLLIAKGLMAAS